ncbi:MAG: ferredoxin family 2Fe-2S iron-sulfur cluster binding protein [Proteobacteria bacterium]|nr:ferredoxin family 2Fe-2S iron-sulfur cluster binding protein [Pseudomonadota bacterium]
MPRMTFIDSAGTSHEVEAPLGHSLLQIAWDNGLDVEGACEGAMACSTCHVIVDPEWYARLDAPTEDEEDMLDLAPGLKPTSRLGCQIIVNEAMDGLTVRLPGSTRNLMLG